MKRYSSWLLLTAAIAAGQQAPPTFRVGTKLVQIDVIARDKKGPAAGLTKENFTIFDNGKPQQISLFSVTSPQTSAPAGIIPIPDGAISNRLNLGGEAPATTTVVLLDRINTSPIDQLTANQRIAKYLETRRKQDRLGIYTLGTNLRVVQDVTNDRDLLNRAANSLKTENKMPGRDKDTTGMSDHAAAEYRALDFRVRVDDTKHTLEAIARHLANVPGRKNLVWVTAGFPLIVIERSFKSDFTPDVEEAARALNDANVSLYAVDARGLIGALSGGTGISNAESGGEPAVPQIIQMRAKMASGPTGIDTMNKLASLTGGTAFYNSNGLEDSIQAAVKDGGLTYTLGFYPSQETQDGLWHKLKVDVDRRGVSVRYRENYFASKAPAEVAARPTLDQLLSDSLDATQVELFAEATPDREHSGSYQVQVSVDLHGVQLGHRNTSWTGALDVSFSVEGSQWRQTITKKVEISEDQLAANLEQRIVVNTTVTPAGQNVVLRIVVQDQATGAAGSIRVPLNRR